MDKLMILKYICQYDDIPNSIDNDNLIFAQTHFFTIGKQNQRTITFNPLNWFCSNFKEILKVCKPVFTKYDHVKPCSLFLDKEVIFHNDKLSNNLLEIICKIKILHFPLLNNSSFDPELYYLHYFQQINIFNFLFHESVINDLFKSQYFFILHGFWYELFPSFLNPQLLLASNTSFIGSYSSDEILSIFFHNKSLFNDSLTFGPLTYLASNIDLIESFVTYKCRKYHFNYNSITKHYLNHGYKDKLSTNSFNHIKYLANNHHRIKKIMCKNSHGKYIWDVYNLTSENISRDFIICKLRNIKINSNNFNDVHFVKTFIDEPSINFNKKLNLDNAYDYFVKFYVLSKYLRYRSSLSFYIINFLQNRTIDSMRQIPLNASRFLIESKFF